MTAAKASIAWRNAAGETTTEDGTISINMKLLFFNGAKKGRLADLSGPAERGHSRQLTLHFGQGECCGIVFEQSSQCDSFERAINGDVKKRKASQLDPGWEETLRAAIAKASGGAGRRFENPLPEAPLLIKESGKAAALLKDVCCAWEKVECEREKTYEEKTRDLMAQGDADRNIRRRLEDETRVLMAQRDEEIRTRQRLENDMEVKLSRADRGLEAVKQQLRELREENAALRKKQEGGGTHEDSMKNIEATAKCIAEFECRPLKGCSEEDLQALKKKLLLKWHPDKQPGPAHAAIATEVMQELQNRPEWRAI